MPKKLCVFKSLISNFKFNPKIKLSCSNSAIKTIADQVTLVVQKVRLTYSTPHYNGVLFAGSLGDDFAAVTEAMDKALREQSHAGMRAAIQQNHQLLLNIGVVPSRVQQFIQAIEEADGVAKICGAGAVAGDQAGAVLLLAEDKKIISSLCARFGYDVIPITGEPRGVYAV